ncbi:MAG: ras guanine nucleotide exchange factor domain-containing protein [Olpidium bornovanus]|uniref:Ras guanine nucleotide exchange factor domain-containing protein n=1 Tax=Olpidium bornovanus TaxID=278681 RepID=A0A8H8DKA9_9FUNG|nr:MAG: ras guanine nucleotide exchange factor domain-containing protein [Olpidium bornovanus]
MAAPFGVPPVDYNFLTDFFFTYRCFLSPVHLCKLLILRFRWALSGLDAARDEARALVRVRTFVAFRHWLSMYYAYDFLESKTLRFTLASFLNGVRSHPVVKDSPRDARIIRSLRTMVRRFRRTYQGESKKLAKGKEVEAAGVMMATPMLGDIHQDFLTATPETRSPVASASATDLESAALYSSSHANSQNRRTSPSVPGRTTSFRPMGHARFLSDTSIGSAMQGVRDRAVGGAAPQHQHYSGDPNAWTLRMTFGLANLRKKIPEVYNSLVTGLGGPGGELDCTCEPRTAPDRQSAPGSPAEQRKMNGLHAVLANPAGARRREHAPGCPLAIFNRGTVLLTPAPYAGASGGAALATTSPSSAAAAAALHDVFPTALSHALPFGSSGYRSFILDHRSELLAQQFCIIEQRNIRGIQWDELVEVTWTKGRRVGSDEPCHRHRARGGAPASGTGVLALIDRFNLVSFLRERKRNEVL